MNEKAEHTFRYVSIFSSILTPQCTFQRDRERVLTLLAGCNGGSSGSDDIRLGGNDNPNGELTGRVFYMSTVDSYFIDLATSELTLYPPMLSRSGMAPTK